MSTDNDASSALIEQGNRVKRSEKAEESSAAAPVESTEITDPRPYRTIPDLPVRTVRNATSRRRPTTPAGCRSQEVKTGGQSPKEIVDNQSTLTTGHRGIVPTILPTRSMESQSTHRYFKTVNPSPRQITWTSSRATNNSKELVEGAGTKLDDSSTSRDRGSFEHPKGTTRQPVQARTLQKQQASQASPASTKQSFASARRAPMLSLTPLDTAMLPCRVPADATAVEDSTEPIEAPHPCTHSHRNSLVQSHTCASSSGDIYSQPDSRSTLSADLIDGSSKKSSCPSSKQPHRSCLCLIETYAEISQKNLLGQTMQGLLSLATGGGRANADSPSSSNLLQIRASILSTVPTSTPCQENKLQHGSQTANPSSIGGVLVEEEGDLLTQSPEYLEHSPASSTYTLSDAESACASHDTPLTSPCLSPVRKEPAQRRVAGRCHGMARLDGISDGPSECSGSDDGCEAPAAQDSCQRPSHNAVCTSNVCCAKTARRQHGYVDLTEVCAPSLLTGLGSSLTPESTTPLTKACRAKGGHEYPFPVSSQRRLTASLLSAQRHPSVLLRHCERNATPRQRRLMAGASQSPDRFVPPRLGTPTKEALLLRRPATKQAALRDRGLDDGADPFGPAVPGTARTDERFATIWHPPSADRQVARIGHILPDVSGPGRRAVSADAIWTVGSTVVTEGVASIANGRGGRVTSGTNAPHYTAGFLRKHTPTEEEVQHGQRLAVAMELQQGERMVVQFPVSSPQSAKSDRRSSCSDVGRRGTFWNNNAWEKQIMTTPTPSPKPKSKDIPVIPFRVLNAPALRDDYYCSLLAYSQTVQCLAVGLGPHVYLWAETRGTTPKQIPESLTAPHGAHVTAVSFSSVEGGSAILAIGRADGRITLWSPLDSEPRFDSEQPAPVSSVCFRPNTVKRSSVRDPSLIVATEELLVGDEAGSVYLYSIEWPSADQRDLFAWHGSMTLLARFSCHGQQICGLAWSQEGEYFATGGNDNLLYLFETKKLFSRSTASNSSSPHSIKVKNGNSEGNGKVAGQGDIKSFEPGAQRHVFTLNAAIKAIAFAPWQPSLVAAGGGSNDRCIHFFHAVSGATLATIDCHAQVTSLIWSEKKKEIAATFGFAQPEHPYRVAVFSWPSCRRVMGIPWWSEERALYAVAYPGGPSGGRAVDQGRVDSEGKPWYGRRTREEGCLVVATSDASIKFHEIWPERREQGRRAVGGGGGLLGGSLILEDGVSAEMEREAVIR